MTGVLTDILGPAPSHEVTNQDVEEDASKLKFNLRGEMDDSLRG